MKSEQNGCRKCGSEMKPSKAIECKLTGYPDFAKDKYPCTVSPDPKQPVQVDCLKCVSCGWSVTIKQNLGFSLLYKAK